jgi:hypothetical protein
LWHLRVVGGKVQGKGDTSTDSQVCLGIRVNSDDDKVARLALEYDCICV